RDCRLHRQSVTDRPGGERHRRRSPPTGTQLAHEASAKSDAPFRLERQERCMTASNENAQPASPEVTREEVREQVGQHLAVRSFVGSEKSRNEDFGTVAEVTIDGTTYSILVISDGVSTSRQPHVAARAACIAGRDAILAELRAGNKHLESCLR